MKQLPDSPTHSIVECCATEPCIPSSFRPAGTQIGQALVDTKRLKIVSSADTEFKDETNQFLELGEAAMLPMEDGNSPVVRDAPKWFQHLAQESDSDYEVARGSSQDM